MLACGLHGVMKTIDVCPQLGKSKMLHGTYFETSVELSRNTSIMVATQINIVWKNAIYVPCMVYLPTLFPLRMSKFCRYVSTWTNIWDNESLYQSAIQPMKHFFLGICHNFPAVFLWFSYGFHLFSERERETESQDLLAALRRVHPAILHGLRRARHPCSDVVVAGGLDDFSC